MIKLDAPSLLFGSNRIYVTGAKTTANTLNANEKARVCLVFANKEEKLAGPVEEMLNKLAAACGFKEDEKVLINATFRTFSLAQAQLLSKLELVILFGKIPLPANMVDIPKNTPVKLGSLSLVVAEELTKLQADGAEKNKLWNALRRALNI